MRNTVKTISFYGVFGELCEDFLKYKQSLGFRYHDEAKVMRRFCHYCSENNVKEASLTKELVLGWTAKRKGESISTRQHRISCIREFARFLNTLGYNTYVFPPQKNTCNKSFVPYVFTHSEISTIIASCDCVKPRAVSPYMHKILPVLIRLLYGCGLRITEALKLKNSNVDLINGILTLHDTKFGKDRLIPMSASLQAIMSDYSREMHEIPVPEGFFFMARDGSMISPMTIYQRFRTILFESGIPHGGKCKGPRLHDMRHTFAVHSLNKWIYDGIDIYCTLPVLSTYMGHTSVSATGKYLRLTAEVFPYITAEVEKTCAYVIPEVNS